MVSKEMAGIKINADDFGINLATTAKIANAYLKGEVDSVSLMVVSPYLKEAVSTIKEYNIPCGLHLSLTYPWMSYRQFLRNYFIGKETQIDHILELQILTYLDTGLPLERIDSHHGVHFLPGIWRICMELMEVYKIPYIRNPVRRPCWFCPNPKLLLGKNKSYLFWKINKQTYGQPLPYKEIIWHA